MFINYQASCVENKNCSYQANFGDLKFRVKVNQSEGCDQSVGGYEPKVWKKMTSKSLIKF